MTTPRTGAAVSLVATMVLTLVSGACVRARSRPALAVPTTIEATRPPTIRFDNDAREHVHVYLIGERREWLLGRVEPGAIVTLRIPEASLSGGPRFMRLAVITGERVTLQAARDPRATFTVAQPASAMLSQQWRFAHGELTPRLR
ncbi:MAG TPA: hypothetical protein VFZ21_26105 [Gemmatimonadaceae bacterium]|nr:hypothetical protein [Gemmatimonadaceae bacterium]